MRGALRLVQIDDVSIVADIFQVGTQNLLALARQGECQVGIDAAFVELIEDYNRHPFEQRVGDEHTRQNSFCYNFDAGGL